MCKDTRENTDWNTKTVLNPEHEGNPQYRGDQGRWDEKSVGRAGTTSPIHGSNLQDFKDLLLTFALWCQTPQGTFRGLVESMRHGGSELFCLHTENQQHIRQVVRMFWLIGVHLTVCSVVIMGPYFMKLNKIRCKRPCRKCFYSLNSWWGLIDWFLCAFLEMVWIVLLWYFSFFQLVHLCKNIEENTVWINTVTIHSFQWQYIFLSHVLCFFNCFCLWNSRPGPEMQIQ